MIYHKRKPPHGPATAVHALYLILILAPPQPPLRACRPPLVHARCCCTLQTLHPRDLKPSNIGLCGQGHVKVFDLGLSVVRPAFGPTTATYEVREGGRGKGGEPERNGMEWLICSGPQKNVCHCHGLWLWLWLLRRCGFCLVGVPATAGGFDHSINNSPASRPAQPVPALLSDSFYLFFCGGGGCLSSMNRSPCTHG